MPEKPWTTEIVIACENPALRDDWDKVAVQLRGIAARVGWDTRGMTKKLDEIIEALWNIRSTTVDMRLPPSKRFKNG